MKNIYLCSVYIILITIASIFSEVAHGQIKIKWEEIPNLAQKINAEVPEGKALLVFEGKEDFIFDSDNENIIQPIKDGLLYKLMIDIEPSSGAITIRHEGAYNCFINYGKTINSASLPALKSKEVKYFRLNLTTPLGWFDITRKKIKEGATDFQALYDKEALVILYVVPQNLDLLIEGSEITNTIHEEGRYKIYIKPAAQKIIIKSKNYDDTPIDFEDLVSKDVRYYHVQPPQSNKGIETFDPNMMIGSYSIESIPVGALIQIIGNKAFNEQQLKTPYTIKNYKEGKETITLALDRYETIIDTILISSTDGKKSTYNLIPKLAFINFNIEPAIPISKISMDGKRLSLIENDKDYECPKGFHNLEIDAPGFYSEILQVSLAAGETNEINIRLRPKTGSFPSGISNTDVFLDGQTGGARYQSASGAGYNRTTSTGYQRTPAAEYQQEPAAFNQNAPATGYIRTTSTGYQRTPTAGYQQEPAAFDQNAPSARYNRTTSTVNQRTSAEGYQEAQAAVNQNAPAAGYNRTTSTVNQRTPAAGYQQESAAVNQNAPAAGYKRTTSTVNQRTSAEGYQEAPAAYNQNAPASRYNRSTSTVNQRTPTAGYQQEPAALNQNAPAAGYNRTTSTVNKRTTVAKKLPQRR